MDRPGRQELPSAALAKLGLAANGAPICEPTDHNCNCTWHLDPTDIEFAELTIEVCDGTPSYIEDNCDDFGARYCPWSAELIELRDCRETGCPMVERM